MSASESVHASLGSMDFVQLVLLFAALFAYVLTLSEAFPARVRGIAAIAALLAAAGFSALTPSWAGGVVVLALAISAIAVFAATVWLFAALLRLDAGGRSRPVGEREEIAVRAARPRLPATPAVIRSS
jgi:hypothetical protein